jgi:hypothetical protein
MPSLEPAAFRTTYIAQTGPMSLDEATAVVKRLEDGTSHETLAERQAYDATPQRRTSMVAPLDRLIEAIEATREALEEVRTSQTEDSDVANADHLQQASRALDALEGHVHDIVP